MKKSPAAPVLETLPRRRPSRAQAEEAVRTLLAWAGDDPGREGLAGTPARVAEAYGEYFSGYDADALAELSSTVDEETGYGDMVLLKDIPFESHCEHHIAPFIGHAHVAYVPGQRITGLSKLSRTVEIFARRLTTQETLTSEIALALMQGLSPKGAAVMLTAEHQCMSMRGVRQRGVGVVTTRFCGCFETEPAWRERFLSMARGEPSRR